MTRVDGQRREHREDALVEERVHLGALLGRERLPVEDLHAVRGEGGAHLIAEDRGLLELEQVGATPDGLEHLAGGQSAGRAYGDAGGDTTLEPSDAHHEELVEVAREDGDELRALEHGELGVLGELEDALVEGEPGELAVEEAIGREGAGLGLDGGHGGLVQLDLGLRDMGLGSVCGHVSMVPQADEAWVTLG